MLVDLRDRCDAVLEALEFEGEWVTNRVTFGKIIPGQIGDIEAGVRQLIRRTPLEIAEYTLPSGRTLRVPTVEETLRVKAFLALKRNQTRDYLDIAALAETMGYEPAGHVLARMDANYADQRGDPDGVASQVARQLSDPRPIDRTVTKQLRSYKGLAARWHQWADVVHACQRLSDLMLEGDPLSRWRSAMSTPMLPTQSAGGRRRRYKRPWNAEASLTGDAIAAEIRDWPWGRVTRGVEEILTYSRPYGVAGLMERVIEAARQRTARSEVEEVAGRIRALREASGLTVGEFASIVGTSRPRMSTYLSGKVVPSAAMVIRMERAARLSPSDCDVVGTGRERAAGAAQGAGSLDLARDQEGR